MADPTTKTAHVRLDERTYDEVAAWAGERGLSMSRALSQLVARGLAAPVTAADLEEALRRSEARAGEAAARSAERMDEAARQMGIARKNIGKATRASYGSLSLLSWLYSDLMRLIRGLGGKGARVEAFATKLTPAEVFRLFEGSGGALQAGSSTDFFSSFRSTLSTPPFRDMDVEELVGVEWDEWERMTGESNDAAALRRIAGGGQDRRD